MCVVVSYFVVLFFVFIFSEVYFSIRIISYYYIASIFHNEQIRTADALGHNLSRYVRFVDFFFVHPFATDYVDSDAKRSAKETFRKVCIPSTKTSIETETHYTPIDLEIKERKVKNTQWKIYVIL